MEFKEKMKINFYSIYIVFYNFIINLFPDDQFTNRFIRPFLARCFGLKYKNKCFIRKNIYYVYPNRIVLGDDVDINRYAYLDAPGKIIIGNNVWIGMNTVILSNVKIGSTI